jgi:predicted O-methyltransferase YrrM
MKFEDAFKNQIWDYNNTMVSEDEAKILYNAVINLKAKLILELGTGFGVSTIALAAAAQEVGGHVYTCDKDSSSIFTDSERVKQKINDLNLMDFCTFYIINDLDMAKQWTATIDLLFIDSEHTYKQTKQELEKFIPFLAEFGECYMHDVAHPDWYMEENAAIFGFLINYEKTKTLQNCSSFDMNSILKTHGKIFTYEVVFTHCGMGKLYYRKTL